MRLKTEVYVILTVLFLACAEDNRFKPAEPAATTLNVVAERAAIEDVRAAFQLAIKEKRYGDLAPYKSDGFEAVSPGSEAWLEYKRQREAKLGQFSYDSIRMFPRETIVANDTLAYDYGTSKVYYTNDAGEPVELEDTYLVILKKDAPGGQWQIHREVASGVVE